MQQESHWRGVAARVLPAVIVAATVGVIVFLGTGSIADVDDPFPRSVSAPVE